MKSKKYTIVMLMLVNSITQAQEEAPTITLSEAVEQGSVIFDTRFRYEEGDQSNRESSEAFTTRVRLGYQTAEYKGFHILGEFEGTRSLNGEENYNPFPQAGKTVIGDPENAELNRLQLGWSGADTKVVLGRQRIVLDNSRHIGNVIWRQNEQTYDGLSLTNQSIDDIKFYYAWIDQVNRIFGEDAPAGPMKRFHSNSHLVNVAYSGFEYGKITAYNYYLDLENGAANSSNTYGISLAGKKGIGESEYSIAYYGEFAKQSDAGDNAADYDASYYHINALLTRKPVSFGLGYEFLGSDNGSSFRFPLSTAHKFNGFADVFLTTPADGLEDFYIIGKYVFPKNVVLTATYHDYKTDEGSQDFGDEWNMVLAYKPNKKWTAIVKWADYNTGDLASPPSTERLSLEVNYVF